MEKEILIDYDEENDILLLHIANQKSAGGIEIGDFIIDFMHDMQKAVGIEILNASKVLSGVFGIDIKKEMLANIKNAALRTVNKGDAVYVYYGLVLQAGETEMPLHSMIPIPQPISV